MKTTTLFIIITIIICQTTLGQDVCTGFESGLNGYRAFAGSNLPSAEDNYCQADIFLNAGNELSIGNLSNTNQGNILNQVVRVTSFTDPNIPISVVSSGNYAIRVGQEENDNSDRDEAHLIKDFIAPSGPFSVSFRMAYVIKALGFDPDNNFNGSHQDPDNDAYFKASVTIAGINTDVTTPDSRFCLRANIYDCQFQEGNPNTGAYYTDWQTVTLDLDPTLYEPGDLLRLRIEVADCAVIEDFSYAYIDDICTNIPESDNNVLCCYDEDSNPIFNISQGCTSIGCDNDNLCDNLNNPIQFRIVDILGQNVSNITYPGIEFSWTNSTTGNTGVGSSFLALVDEQVTVTLSLNNCEITFDSLVSCATPPDCDSNLLPINFGNNSFQWRTPRDIVIDSQNNFYMLLGNMKNQSQQFTDIEDHNFEIKGYVLKFSQEQCLLDYIELPSPYNWYYAFLEIDSNDHLYVQGTTSQRNIKLDSDLQIIFDVQARYGNVYEPRTLSVSENINTNSMKHMVSYVVRNGNATINNQPIYNSPLPYDSPLAAILNSNNGLPLDFYAFNLGEAKGASIIAEITENALYTLVKTRPTTSGNFTFAGTTINYSANSFVQFIAKFNISDGVNMIPELIASIPATRDYKQVEYNSTSGGLYLAGPSYVHSYNSSLIYTGASYALSGTRCTDLEYDQGSGTLLVATNSNPTKPIHLRLLENDLSSSIWELQETLINPNEGIYFPSITRKNDDIYLTGIYNSNFSLNNGLPPSTDYDLYLEYFDANTPLTRDSERKTIGSITNYTTAFPNPFSNQIFFRDPLDRTISRIELYDALGLKIKSQAYLKDTPIRLKTGVSGLYFAKVYFEDGTIETIELLKK